MDKIRITKLDGSKEQREKTMKDFFGLRPDQTFQDIDVDIDDKDEDGEKDEKNE